EFAGNDNFIPAVTWCLIHVEVT
ncbi:hypothetical protein CPC197_0713, partial [Chlamydia psittaci C1/97]